MSFTVAVTRPEPQASETAARLAGRGYAVVRAPLLVPEPVDGWGTPAGVGAVALTSRTAARLIAAHPEFHDIATFCVGAATAEEAAASGVRDVRQADGDVAALADLMRGSALATAVHFCGEDHRGDLAGALAAAGIAAERRVVYRMAPAASLPPCAGPLDAALLYSPRTAEIFTRLGTGAPWRQAACVALSAAVAARAPRGVVVATAARPDEPALFEALDRLREEQGALR